MRIKIPCIAIATWLTCNVLPVTAGTSEWQKYLDSGTEAAKAGRFADAEKQLNLAVKEAEKLGPKDPKLAVRWNQLGLVYQDQGKTAEAEKQFKLALEIREKAVGADKKEVAESLENLATCLAESGKYSDAESLTQRSLTIREKVQGKDHADVATTLDNLAGLKDGEGKCA